MVSFVSAVELCCIDQMPRYELLNALKARASDLPQDLCENLESQPMDRLQLLLLTARLIYVLRHLRPGV
jgi:hypothetical protein